MKLLRLISIVLLLVVAVNALAAGYLLMSEPSGGRLGMSTELLRFSSFKNFFVPGLVLFSVNGMLALVTAFVLIRKMTLYPFWIFCQGLLLTGWILIQVVLLREFNFLHAIMGTTGIFFIVAGFLFLGANQRLVRK